MKVMNTKNKLGAVILSLAISISILLSGCGNQENNADTIRSQSRGQASDKDEVSRTEPVTIKILHKGPKPERWDAVYAEYLNRTRDTLNIALDINWVEHSDYSEKLNMEITVGGDWDLVFDAAWIQLKNLASEGYYADLSEYFNNPEYPGLQKSFSSEVMEANTWFGKMCYIPLFEAYGNGIPCIWYRADWAREWGIGTDGQINSYEELEQYWQAAKKEDIIPYGTIQTRGFFHLKSLRGESFEGAAQAGIQSVQAGGLTFWIYSKDGQLIDIAVEASGDEAFVNFPEGWNYDFGVERYEDFAKWQEAGYIDPDSLSCTDCEMSFEAGLCASMIGTLDDYSKKVSQSKEWESGEQGIGMFLYVDSVRDMKKGAIAVDRNGNNGWCIPESSTKKDVTMKFLDWMFASQENHDLIQLGIEGIDFRYGENEGTYDTLTSYSADLGGYSFSWNPVYALINTQYEGKALEYRQYELKPDTFSFYNILGFRFDTSDIALSTSVASCTAVTDMVSIVKMHGIKTDGYGNSYNTMREMLNANVKEAMKKGGQDIYDALWKQLETYLAQ